MRTTTLLVALLAMSQLTAVTAQDSLKVQTITPQLSVLFGKGGNIGVFSGPDGVVLIDDQYAPATPQILAAVAELSDAPLRFVLNTHWHGDHTGGNENLGKAGSLIMAHDGVRRRMSSEQFITAFKQAVPASPPAALPVVTFGDDLSLHLNGDTLNAFHVARAHTDGDSIVRFERANVLHMGDVMFLGTYPFIDLSSGGSIDGVIKALERALSKSDSKTTVIPGHGSITDQAGLKAYLSMLRDIRERVQAGLAAGQSVEEIIANRPTAAYDEGRSGGFISADSFVRTVASSLRPTP